MKAEQIIEAMSKQGMRITDQRRSLAALFAKADGYLTPKDVYDHMGKIYSGLSFDTVYRNLRVMHEMGVLEQFVFEDGIKFRVHCQEKEHHHHIICMQCLKTYPLVYCPMEQAGELPDGFEAVKHKFEVYGYCKDCKPAEEAR
ncbi:Fur family transcriptional regulator [Gorillibacterium sp. sgz5001074]|uniref:Fur family transcriptional regulator n=1 Tax=Gorillibacterium sp. sgz5001074 TaxID=3446695 RepID=UPI003F6613F9